MKSLSLAFFLTVLTLPAQSQRLSSGTEILKNVEKSIEGVRDYVVDLEADICMERVQVPRSKATMYFKKPDKVHFESTGIVLLPREGMSLSTSVLLQRYTATNLGDDTAGNRKVFKLQLAAKDAQERLRQLFVWVEPDNWTVLRIQTVPYEGRVLTLDFVYGLQEGRYWMPVMLKANFGLLNEETPKKLQEVAPPTPLDEMQQRVPRSGSISIAYANYRINVGLPDEMFEQKKDRQ